MEFKTKPFAHQLKAFELSKDQPVYALLMEQGTGKTKVAIDNVAYLYELGKIDALLVVAPNGVHRNWSNDEIPAHLSDSIKRMCLTWRSGAAGTKTFARAFKDLIEFDGLAIFTMNVESLITIAGRTVIKEFLTKRKVFFAIDESTDIKTPGAKRTKAARTFGRFAPYRRILTGTPTGDGNPLDLYSQFAFLDPAILGHSTYTTYKHEYAIEELRQWPGARRPVQVVVGYKNVERIGKLIEPYSFRITKDEALDLPPKIYTKRYFELSKQQASIYSELRCNFMAEIENGIVVTAPMVITRWLRLQQIACGYVGVEVGEPVHTIPGPNPRMDLLERTLEEFPGKTIIWCRFTPDIDQIILRFGDQAVRYDGIVTNDERERAKNEFQNGDVRLFVGNPKAGGRGLTLHAAKNVIFYSNYFSYETRIQAEDRAHRMGLEHSVNYIDFVAENTVDERIIKSLRNKQDVSSLIMGEPNKEWI